MGIQNEIKKQPRPSLNLSQDSASIYAHIQVEIKFYMLAKVSVFCKEKF